MSRSAELFGDATSVSVLDVFRLGCLIHHVIFKRDAFRIVLRKPCIGGVAVRKDLEVIRVADLLAGIDVDPDRFI